MARLWSRGRRAAQGRQITERSSRVDGECLLVSGLSWQGLDMCAFVRSFSWPSSCLALAAVCRGCTRIYRPFFFSSQCSRFLHDVICLSQELVRGARAIIFLVDDGPYLGRSLLECRHVVHHSLSFTKESKMLSTNFAAITCVRVR